MISSTTNIFVVVVNDEIISQQETSHLEVENEVAAKDVVECILDEALHSVVVSSDRGCRIGDYNVTEDFSQQFGHVSLSSSESDSCTVTHLSTEGQYPSSQFVQNFNPSKTLQFDDELLTRESISKTGSVSSENGGKSEMRQYKVINNQVLENNELRIENGQIRIEINKPVKPVDALRNDFFNKEEVIKDEKIEIEYFNGEKYDKIYVPLNKNSSTNVTETNLNVNENQSADMKDLIAEDSSNNETSIGSIGISGNDFREERKITPPFSPITSEELREAILQVWGNSISSNVIGWDGDMSNQPEDITRLMKGLSTLQIIPSVIADPNRPRACTFAEEDVKRIIKEIEEINFNQNRLSSENVGTSCHIDGQGDYDIDSEPKVLFENEFSQRLCDKVSSRDSGSEDLKSLIEQYQEENNPEREMVTTSPHSSTTDGYVQQNDSASEIDIKEVPSLHEELMKGNFFEESVYYDEVTTSNDSFVNDESPEYVEYKKSLQLFGVHIDSSCDYDESPVSPSQKFVENFDFDVNSSLCTTFVTSTSTEDILDASESVIQIIDPQNEEAEKNEDDEEENTSSKISFSLLNQREIENYYKNQGLKMDSDSELSEVINSEGKFRDRENDDPRKVKSGMTTVGPIKNLDRDPKDLSSPEVDFGRMIHISGSQKITRGNMQSSSNISKNETIIDNPDDQEIHILSGDGYVTVTTLVNHDIASLTKVQKIKEVISHQPDEDLSDDLNLANRLLDLKDIDSATNEGFKELNIPLISFEIQDPAVSSDADEILQNVPLVISGSRIMTPAMHTVNDDVLLEGTESGRNIYIHGHSFPNITEQMPDEKLIKAHSTKTFLNRNEDYVIVNLMDGTQKDMETRFNSNQVDGNTEHVFKINSNVQSDSVVNQKRNTISNVFRKASNKFSRKDSDSFLRNSKSLPRDTRKFSMAGADSVKSLLDECQHSAATVLKKSRTLLKNTQSLFRTLSHTQFTDSSVNKSQTDLSNQERRPATCSKKDELIKAKNSLKKKISKTFKSIENFGASADNRDVPTEKKGLSLVLKNKKDYRLEKIDYVRKLLPKSPLVYRSEIPQPQQQDINSNQSDEVISSVNLENHVSFVKDALELNGSVHDTEEDRKIETVQNQENDKEVEISCEENFNDEFFCIGDRGDLHSRGRRSSKDIGVNLDRKSYVVINSNDVLQGSTGETEENINSAGTQIENALRETEIEIEKTEEIFRKSLMTGILSDLSILKRGNDAEVVKEVMDQLDSLNESNISPSSIHNEVETEIGTASDELPKQYAEIKVAENNDPNLSSNDQFTSIPLNEPEDIHAESQKISDPSSASRNAHILDDIKVTISSPEKCKKLTSEVPEMQYVIANASDITNKLSDDVNETCSSRGTLKMDKILSASLSDMKKRKKNKKLSARIRSFWNSTFGKLVKSPTKKKEDS